MIKVKEKVNDFELDGVPNFKKKHKSICMIPDLTMSS